jgi:hypothetical protein
MCLMLIAAMVMSVSEGDVITVHEWGVVMYGTGGVTAVGEAGSPPLLPVCVDAPVLFFHGAPFTGDVTICSLGRIFSTHPEPDRAGGPMMDMDLGGLGSAVQWLDLSVAPDADDLEAADRRSLDALSADGFGWAFPLWRSCGSRITRPDGFSDGFLYYEVDMTEAGLPVPERRGVVLERLPDGTVSCVDPEDGDMPADESIPVPDGRTLEGLRTEVARWAGDRLTPEEMAAMWATWEPWILYGDWGGSRLEIFPVPGEIVERISTVTVVPDSGAPVLLERFFLGMAPAD